MIVIAAGYVFGLALYLILRFVFGDRFWWLAFLNNFAPYFFIPLLIAVPVTIVIRTWGLLALGAPLLIVGVVRYGPYFVSKTRSVPAGRALRIVTFNVLGSNPHLDGVLAWLRDVNADVVVLQEIPLSFIRSTLPTLRDIYPYQFAPSTPTGWWDNVTLSRFPILSADILDALPDNPLPTIHRLTLDFHGNTIALYNIHLEAPLRQTPRLMPGISQRFLRLALRYDDCVRNCQIEKLVAHLRSEPYPFVVAGDFNTSDQASGYRKLSAHLVDSFKEAGTGFGTSWPVSASGDFPSFVPPLCRIDYVWHSGAFAARYSGRGPRLGSDHLPVLATLELLPNSH